MKHNFKELKIWQTGMEISDLIYEFIATQRRKIGNGDLRNRLLLILDEEQKMIFKFREKILNQRSSQVSSLKI